MACLWSRVFFKNLPLVVMQRDARVCQRQLSYLLHLALPFISSLQLAGNCRHFKLNVWVEHSKSQPTDDKLSLKGAWSRHATSFKFLVPPNISLERLKLETSNLVCMLIIASPSLQITNCPCKGVVTVTRPLLIFWKIKQ